jgi:hypothetical protein
MVNLFEFNGLVAAMRAPRPDRASKLSPVNDAAAIELS